MRRAVLFDLDGTLHDREAGLREFVSAQHARHTLDSYGIGPEKWRDAFLRLDDRGRVWKDVVYRALVERFDAPLDPAALLEEYETGFAAFIRPYGDPVATLRACRRAGWKTGLVTNGRSVFQRRTLAALGIDALLDVVIVSEACGLRKPDPEIFRRALDALGCEAANSWFVGDDSIADVEGAAAIGIRTLLFAPDEDPSPDRVESLAAVVERIA